MKLTAVVFLMLIVMACGRPYQPETIQAAQKGRISPYQYDEGVRALKLLGAAGNASGYLPCVLNRANEALPHSASTDLAVVEGEHYCQDKQPIFVSEVRRRADEWGLDPDFPAEEMNPATSPDLHGLFVKTFNETRLSGATTGEQSGAAAPSQSYQQAEGASAPAVGSREGKSLEGYGILKFSMNFAEAKKLLGSKATDVGTCEFGDPALGVKSRCLEFVELKETTKFVVTAAFNDKQMHLVRIVVRPLVGPDHFTSDECWRIMEQMAIRYSLEFGMPDDGFPIKRGVLFVTGSQPDDPSNLLVGEAIFIFPKGGTIDIEGLDTPAKNECNVLVFYEPGDLKY